MLIRLGYVAISKTIKDDFHNITYTDFCKNNNYEKLDYVVKENFKTFKNILIYNIKNNIHFYRLTSKFIPLATHENVSFDYIKKYKDLYNEILPLIKDIRVDVHPDQFTVLNSTKQTVLDNTVRSLEYHYKILDAFGVSKKVIILHVGSSVFGKKNSLKRFINNFEALPDYLKSSIALENDDKVYNLKDVLYLCQTLNVPFVFDYHHYRCNNDGENYLDYLKDIFATWKKEKPKMHFSSPKNKTKKDFRSHSDYIDCDDFINFLEEIKSFNTDVDIMLEAKEKDDAVFKLVRQLKCKTNYKFVDDTSFIV